MLLISYISVYTNSQTYDKNKCGTNKVHRLHFLNLAWGQVVVLLVFVQKNKWRTKREQKQRRGEPKGIAKGDVAQFDSFHRHMDKLRLKKWTVCACNELCVFSSVIHTFGSVWTMPSKIIHQTQYDVMCFPQLLCKSHTIYTHHTC